MPAARSYTVNDAAHLGESRERSGAYKVPSRLVERWLNIYGARDTAKLRRRGSRITAGGDTVLD
jgi:hypothetical protein